MPTSLSVLSAEARVKKEYRGGVPCAVTNRPHFGSSVTATRADHAAPSGPPENLLRLTAPPGLANQIRCREHDPHEQCTHAGKQNYLIEY
jgi:hypothetical protein